MNLYNETKYLLKKYNMTANKKLGQNFLIDENAIKYDEISYLDILNKDLKVMDSTATSLCRDNNIPLIVFAMNEKGNMVKAVKGEKVGTLVK